VLLAARRSAINASTEAQQQVFSLVIAAPEPVRVRFRGQKLAAMLNTAANLRVHASWDTETASTVVALRTLARRAHAMLKEAREPQKAMLGIIRSWRPELLEEFGVGPIVALHTVVQSRIQYQQATRDYVARRTAEGKTAREIKRCLARYVARDLYRLLESEGTTA
jgi:transposase